MFHTYDFICLQETRICGMVRKNDFQGYTAYFSGHEFKREYGVGLLVKTSLAKGVLYTDYVDDRILIVAGIFRGTHQCIVSVYGP